MGWSMALTAVSFGMNAMKAVGAAQAGEAEAANARYQAQIAKNNAEYARRNAELATQEGDIEATAQGLKTRARIGTTKAAQAANGIDVNTGSAVDVRVSEQELGILDALTIRSNAARQAYGYQINAQDQTAQARLLKSQASQAKTSGYLDAFGTLLDGASSAGQNYNSWSRVAGAGSSSAGGFLRNDPSNANGLALF